MKMKRRITVFVATFAVVMIGGAALAAVGVVSPPTSSPTSNIAAAATEPEAAPTSPAISTSPDALTPADTQPRLDIRLDASDLVPVHEFTAHQRYEVVDGWPVVNYYWGTAKPGAEVHIGSEYGRGTTAANDDGKWEIRVEFPTAPCNEPFRVAAESGDHRKEFKMTRACRVHEFTAHQRYEVVDGWPVVNYYWGTAKPGAEVHIGSEYGRGTTAANDDGKWEIRVEFPTAPCNEPFRVAAESGDHRKEFKMTRACRVHEFTAHQRYEVVDGWPVVNYYWGTAKPGAEVHIGSEYGRGTTAANDDGKWEIRVEFPTAPCNEPFRVAAESGDHRKEFKMTRACEVDVVLDFTAHQKYGECSEDVPYDVFWGTAAAGATITVESPHGRASTAAGEKGHWELKVEFPDAPVGEVFDVVVESSDGGRSVFSFVNVGQES